MLTFTMSIVWIGVLSFLMVRVCNSGVVGCCLVVLLQCRWLSDTDLAPSLPPFLRWTLPHALAV